LKTEEDKKLVLTKKLDVKSAKALQELFRSRVIIEDRIGTISRVAGCDVSCSRFSSLVHAGIVCLNKQGWKEMTTASASLPTNFPYIPGFLAFREIPCLLAAFERLEVKPDLLFVDGHGICHPRGLGIASHLGVLLDIPTIGVGKSILTGKPAGQLGSFPGDTTDLLWQGKTVGLLLRSKARCRPIIISIGHKISLQTALNLVLDSLKGYRLPEPTRLAHAAANHKRLTYGKV